MTRLGEPRTCPFSGKKCTSECQLYIGDDWSNCACVFQRISSLLGQTVRTVDDIYRCENV